MRPPEFVELVQAAVPYIAPDNAGKAEWRRLAQAVRGAQQSAVFGTSWPASAVDLVTAAELALARLPDVGMARAISAALDAAWPASRR